jgi:hypothetical protein
MSKYTKLRLFLKDQQSQIDNNKHILEFLHSYHTKINDNGYTIRIDIIDQSNINQFALEGIQTIPALQTNGEFIYGTSAIITELVEIGKEKFQQQEEQPKYKKDNMQNIFQKEIFSTDQEDANEEPQSTGKKPGRQDYEQAVDEKDLSARLEAMNNQFANRKIPLKGGSKHVQSYTPTGLNLGATTAHNDARITPIKKKNAQQAIQDMMFGGGSDD